MAFKSNVSFGRGDTLETTQRKLNELLKKLEQATGGGTTTITVSGGGGGGGGGTTSATIGVRDVTGSVVTASGTALSFDDTDGFVVTNDGAYGSGYQMRIDLSQSIKTTASPTFAGLTLSNLTATRVLFAGASKQVTDDAGLTYVAGTDTLSVGNITVTTNVIVSSLTATRIPYAGATKELVDAAGLTWTAGTNTLTATNAVVSTQLTVGSLSGVLKATAGVVSGSATTADLTENTNLYYTDARARAAISASSPVAYDNNTGVISIGTIPITSGGTGQTTAMAGLVALLPSLSGNNGKHLAVKAGETEVEWVTPSAPGGGITTLNTLTADPQTFAKTDDTNVTLTITSATATHTFALGWTSTLAVARGGTGSGTAAGARVNLLPSLTGNAGKFLKVSAGEADVEWATVTGGATPGGSDTHVQFNDGGSSFGGEADFTYNKTTNVAYVAGAVTIGANAAAAGALRLANNTSIIWRNAANDGDLAYKITATSGDAVTIGSSGANLITVNSSGVYLGNGSGIVSITSGLVSVTADGTANQVLGMNAAANGKEYKTITATANQVSVTHGVGTITLATPQDIHTAATPQFGTLGLGAAASGTYILYAKGNALFEGTQGFNAAGETATVYLGDGTKGIQAVYGTGLNLFVNQGTAVSYNENTKLGTYGGSILFAWAEDPDTEVVIDRTINPAAAANAKAGATLTIAAGAAGQGGDSLAGPPLILVGGQGDTNAQGGHVRAYGGTGLTKGNVQLAWNGSAAQGVVTVGTATATASTLLTVAGSASVLIDTKTLTIFPSVTGNGGKVLALKSDISNVEWVSLPAGATYEAVDNILKNQVFS